MSYDIVYVCRDFDGNIKVSTGSNCLPGLASDFGSVVCPDEVVNADAVVVGFEFGRAFFYEFDSSRLYSLGPDEDLSQEWLEDDEDVIPDVIIARVKRLRALKNVRPTYAEVCF